MSPWQDWNPRESDFEDDEKKEEDYADEFEFNIPGPAPSSPDDLGRDLTPATDGQRTVNGHLPHDGDYMSHINLDACS